MDSIDYYQEYIKYKREYHDLKSSVEYELLGGRKKTKKSRKTKKSKKSKKTKKSTEDINNEFIDAIKGGDAMLTKKLLIRHKKNININSSDEEGNTPLHLAVHTNHKIVKLLLENGAKVNSSNDEGDTALHSVIISELPTTKKIKIIRILLASDAKINKSNDSGNTALHLAVIEVNPKIVRELVGEDAKLGIKNENNNTPVKIALKFLKTETDRTEVKKLRKIVDALDPDDEYEDMLVVSPISHSSHSTTQTPMVIYDDSITGSSTASSIQVIVNDDCNLDFNRFLGEYFKYNYVQLVKLMSFEGNNIPIRLKCTPGYAPPANSQTSWKTHWRQLGELWDLYKRKLQLKHQGQDLLFTSGQCWDEPAIDFYLLFLMYKTRQTMLNKGIRVCPKRPNVAKDQRNKVFIEPNYNLNIYDGGDRANLKIRNTFEQLLGLLNRARVGSYLQYGMVMTPYLQKEYLFI